jgi:hypothetical protein
MKKLVLSLLCLGFASSLYAQFTGTNPVTLSATGMFAYFRVGLNTDYAWMQSYGPRPLRINDLGNDVLFNTGGGNVGIGTVSPDAKLSLFGPAGTLFSMGATGANAYFKMGISTDYAWIQSYGPRPLRINDAGNNVIFNVGGGSVAIGTPLTQNTNGYKLAVKGKIGAHEVQVENTSNAWADYVFEPDYKLISLDEVEDFIKTNKHLPEIPSAEEVKVNGHKLGEMDVLLLKKIEEMTLYVIQQQNQIKELTERLKKLESQN